MSKSHRALAESKGIHNFSFTSRKALTHFSVNARHDAILVEPAFEMKNHFQDELMMVGRAFAPYCERFCIVMVG
jgi:hypothetical protein